MARGPECDTGCWGEEVPTPPLGSGWPVWRRGLSWGGGEELCGCFPLPGLWLIVGRRPPWVFAGARPSVCRRVSGGESQGLSADRCLSAVLLT